LPDLDGGGNRRVVPRLGARRPDSGPGRRPAAPPQRARGPRALVLVVTLVAANFVLVDVGLWGLRVETRLAWAAVVPAALGFAGGVLYSRARWAARRAESTYAPGAGNGGDEHPARTAQGRGTGTADEGAW
jgi:hypothetical protein